jgi:hypothetical protein
MTRTLPSTLIPKLTKMILVLSSDQDGDVIATARAVGRLLKVNGYDWHDLAASLRSTPVVQFPTADWRRNVRFCASHAALLTGRERDFIATLTRWRGSPTDKQLKWLSDITSRLRGAA